MKRDAWRCTHCKKWVPASKRSGSGSGGPWCIACRETESARAAREDSVPGKLGLFTRPPKYVLRPDEWAAFGYAEED